MATATGRASAWDAATGKALFRIAAHRGRLTALAVSRNGTLATAGADHCIRLWDGTTRKPLVPEVLPAGPIRSLSASKDGKQLAILTFAGDLLRWDSKGKAVPMPGIKDARAALVSPDGDSVLVLGTDGKTARHFKGKATALPLPSSDRLARSADGKRLAALHRAGPWRLHDADGKALRRLVGSESSRVAVLSADGALVAAVGGAAAVPVWDGTTGKLRRTLPGHRGGTMAGAFSPDGRMLVTGGRDRLLRFWDVGTGRELASPRGQTAWVTAVAISADGKRIACGSADGTVQVRSSRGELLAERKGHRGPVNTLAFLDGIRLASAGEDTSVLVWDLSALGKAGTLKPTPGEMAELWKRMTDADPATASSAQERLALAGDAVLEIVRRDVKPVAARLAARLMKELADDDLDVRKRAGEALRSRAYEAMLHKALAGRPSLDMVKRIEKILAELAGLPEGEHRRGLRAVEVLEAIGSPAAKMLLAELATGAPDAELTEGAKAALARLER